MNYLTEVISLGVLSTSVTTPSQRDFVFDFDFDGQNFMRVDVMSPQFVKGGTSTAESRNGLAFNGINTLLTGNTTTSNTVLITINTSFTGTAYTSNVVSFQTTFDRVNNKILLSIMATGTPTIPTWCCLNFRAWTVI